MKKFLSVILAVVMIITAMPLASLNLTASAEDEYTEGYYTYSVSNGKATITDVDESISGDVIVPGSLGGYPVTSIGNLAFEWCNEITSVTISNSVTSIGSSAFDCCSSLTSITIPNSVISIGSSAFYNCSNLTSIAVSESNSNYCSVDGVLFNKGKTELIRYPEGETTTEYVIPNSVTSIGEGAFSDCSSLKSVTIPNSVTIIGDRAFYWCASLTSITIPNSVTSIGNYAFWDCSSLTSITISNSVISIGDRAFYWCASLTSITIPDSVTSIGSYAFDSDIVIYCNKNSAASNYLTANNHKWYVYLDGTDEESIVGGEVGKYNWSFDKRTGVLDLTGSGDMIDFSTVNAPWYEYRYCVTSIKLPQTLTKIGAEAFCNMYRVTSITIPGSVTSIGSSAFDGCSCLKNVYITDIAAWCNIGFDNYYSNPLFYADNLYLNGNLITNLVIPNGLTSIGDYAFYDCDSLTNVTFPNSVTSIGNYAFYDCSSLTSITIPNGVTSIGYYAFYGCCSLTSVTIPNSVTSIGYCAFYDCSNLETVTIYSTDCEFDSFCGLDYNHIIYGFKGSTAETFANEIGAEFIDVETIHSHTLNSGVVAKAATCKEAGVKTYTCSVCRITKTSAIAKLTTHKYSAATCVKPKTCKVCGITNGKALGHKYTNKCDTSCNVCKAVRKITHTYKTATTKATLKKNGKVVKKCSVCGKIASTTTVYYPKTVKIAKTNYTYIGKVIKPAITVKNSKGKVIAKSNYTVTYAKGRKNVGKYKVTVTFKGNYKGTKTFYFTINPVKTTVNKLVAGKKSLKVTIGKKTNQVTGYEIQYATNKTFKSAKKVNVKSYKTTSVTLKKLAAKKTYYVRVRTYKTVSGKKYYSAWSAYKYKKTK